MKHCDQLEFDDGSIIIFKDYNTVIIGNKNPGFRQTFSTYWQLETDKLIFDLNTFNGFMFLDKHNNFYNTFQKRIYFNSGCNFEGNFSLFHNYYEMENKINEAIEIIKNEPN